MAEFDDSTIARFWSKVDKSSECWIWTGKKLATGYGHFFYFGRHARAHRVSWLLSNGPIVGGLCVLHQCDVPLCVRPSHLRLGTQLENVAEMIARGRGARGGRNGRAKTTESDVLEMRRCIAAGQSCAHLARRFNLGQSTVRDIKRRVTWRHLQ